MKTVLFATDHMPPDPKALDYALLLCRRIAACLDVLHILPSSTRPRGTSRGCQDGLGIMRQAFAGAMDPIGTDASRTPGKESGRNASAPPQLRQLLQDHRPETRVNYRCETSEESPGAIIERYVRDHRNIVLTVVDSQPHGERTGGKGKTTRPAVKWAMPRLRVPLVLVKKTQ